MRAFRFVLGVLVVAVALFAVAVLTAAPAPAQEPRTCVAFKDALRAVAQHVTIESVVKLTRA